MPLAQNLQNLVADVFVLYLRAHGYHWNVEGSDFFQYHGLFDEIASDIYGSLDPLAENIRKLGEYAPFTLQSFAASTVLTTNRVPTNPRSMASDLLEGNETVIGRLNECFKSANDEDQQGIANFLAERIDAHQKWSWFLKSAIK